MLRPYESWNSENVWPWLLIYYALRGFKGWYLVDYHLAQHRHDVSRVETVGDGDTVNHDFLFHS